MKSFFPYYVIAILLASLFALLGRNSKTIYAQDTVPPTPTFDPLAEPFVPDNPTGYELGRNWYWHHCMPCHGDVGQGLTDEFRAIWPEDHQNCWERGCHAGRSEDFGFPIPTVVPPVVSNTKLARFSSQQTLFEYLKATHPPQHPGYLSDEQYQAIALYVFRLNDRLPLERALTPTVTAILTFTPMPDLVPEEEIPLQLNMVLYIVLGIIFAIAMLWGVQKRLKK